MRLTMPKNNRYGDYELISNEFGNEEQEAFNKLGQLEDIEEELGIDLVTLMKALKDGVYFHQVNAKGDYEEAFNTICFCKTYYINFNKSNPFDLISWSWDGYPIKFKDYGITWALTKEELE